MDINNNNNNSLLCNYFICKMNYMCLLSLNLFFLLKHKRKKPFTWLNTMLRSVTSNSYWDRYASNCHGPIPKISSLPTVTSIKIDTRLKTLGQSIEYLTKYHLNRLNIPSLNAPCLTNDYLKQLNFHISVDLLQFCNNITTHSPSLFNYTKSQPSITSTKQFVELYQQCYIMNQFHATHSLECPANVGQAIQCDQMHSLYGDSSCNDANIVLFNKSFICSGFQLFSTSKVGICVEGAVLCCITSQIEQSKISSFVSQYQELFNDDKCVPPFKEFSRMTKREGLSYQYQYIFEGELLYIPQNSLCLMIAVKSGRCTGRTVVEYIPCSNKQDKHFISSPTNDGSECVEWWKSDSVCNHIHCYIY